MTQRNDQQNLETAVRAMKNDQPSDVEIQDAGARIWQTMQTAVSADAPQPEMIHGCEDIVKLLPAYSAGELSSQRALVVESHLRDCVGCRNQAKGRAASAAVKWTGLITARPAFAWRGFAAAAAVVVLAVSAFLVMGIYFAVPAGARASIQSIDGVAYHVTPDGERIASVGEQLNQGDVLRTGAGAHAFLKMTDGSIIEANQRTDIALTARGKNATIALDRGAVIVQAAKRQSGHLYVKTPDCRVAVTGTVFAVGAGVKGSRVSVVEGSVDVAYGSNDDTLHSGEQVSTGSNMTPVPVAEDIAWSHDLPSHLELLAQFSQLQKSLDQVQLPATRFNSDLMARMPSDAIVYASLPNAGQALEDANRILQEQILQSDSLRAWFTRGTPDAPEKLNEAVAKIRQLSEYLGDEVVVVGFGGKSGMAVVADIKRSGLQDFLKTQFAPVVGKSGLVVIDQSAMASAPQNSQGLIALVRHDVVVFASNRDVLSKVNTQLNAGAGGLATTDFGKQLADSYSRGAGFLLAADLGQLITVSENHNTTHANLQPTGLQDARYLIVEHRELKGIPDNHLLLDFAADRRGVASWLASPAPMGSLQFVSRNASLAVALIAKEPALVLDDIFNMAGGDKAKRDADIADAEALLKVRFREDIAAHFGGDAVFALDGPILPAPAWKAVIEIHDANALAASIQKLVAGINEEAQRKGKPGVNLNVENVSGQLYYTLKSTRSDATAINFTFASGYMIIGPDRAVLMNTLRTRSTGDSLGQSAQFKALLPKDQNNNYSVIAYQNLHPVLEPLLSQVSGDQVKWVQQLAADSRPSVICAWGRQSQIEAASNSRLLGLDWLTLGNLISGGTAKHKTS